MVSMAKSYAREKSIVIVVAFQASISLQLIVPVAAMEGKNMARKTILVCDNCSSEVAEGKGAVMRLNFTDARRGSKQADLCDACAGKMPGQAVARRGRRPKSAVA